MTPDSLVIAFLDADVTLPLLCSLVAGALIGGEREFQGKPAGLRTHTLVCFASALMTLIGLRMAEWTAELPTDAQIVSDMARMPHAILTGIGFLGAGVIFREGVTVQGLTTAASLWLTAALGIVFGTGLLELGTIGTATALVVLVVLRLVSDMMPTKAVFRLEVAVPSGSGYDSAILSADLAGLGLRVSSMSILNDRKHGLRRYRLLLTGQDTIVNCERLLVSLPNAAEMQEIAIESFENDPTSGT